jgi:hypothetical protein
MTINVLSYGNSIGLILRIILEWSRLPLKPESHRSWKLVNNSINLLCQPYQTTVAEWANRLRRMWRVYRWRHPSAGRYAPSPVQSLPADDAVGPPLLLLLIAKNKRITIIFLTHPFWQLRSHACRTAVISSDNRKRSTFHSWYMLLANLCG